jgi:hypothetical protein
MLIAGHTSIPIAKQPSLVKRFLVKRAMLKSDCILCYVLKAQLFSFGEKEIDESGCRRSKMLQSKKKLSTRVILLRVSNSKRQGHHCFDEFIHTG